MKLKLIVMTAVVAFAASGCCCDPFGCLGLLVGGGRVVQADGPLEETPLALQQTRLGAMKTASQVRY